MNMIYKAPFKAITTALYSVLTSTGCDVGLAWFDSAIPMNEIYDNFKGQVEFAYGEFGASDADPIKNKTEIVWDANLDLMIYSNYRGRKVIAEMLENLLNYLSDDGYDALEEALKLEGFALIELMIKPMRINLPTYSDYGVWQSGSTSITFRIHQLKQ